MMYYILNKKMKVIFVFYLNYELDEIGIYIFIIGMIVFLLEDVFENMIILIIFVVIYVVFIMRKGLVVEVVCEVWEYIW